MVSWGLDSCCESLSTGSNRIWLTIVRLCGAFIGHFLYLKKDSEKVGISNVGIFRFVLLVVWMSSRRAFQSPVGRTGSGVHPGSSWGKKTRAGAVSTSRVQCASHHIMARFSLLPTLCPSQKAVFPLLWEVIFQMFAWSRMEQGSRSNSYQNSFFSSFLIFLALLPSFFYPQFQRTLASIFSLPPYCFEITFFSCLLSWLRLIFLFCNLHNFVVSLSPFLLALSF